MSNEDIKQLDLLSVFHYVVGGITALFSCMPFGTVLGVSTLVALSKDSVRAVFAPTCANEIPVAPPQA